jgi:hypothetical protein
MLVKKCTQDAKVHAIVEVEGREFSRNGAFAVRATKQE